VLYTTKVEDFFSEMSLDHTSLCFLILREEEKKIMEFVL
jgi:hypothetical protein